MAWAPSSTPYDPNQNLAAVAWSERSAKELQQATAMGDARRFFDALAAADLARELDPTYVPALRNYACAVEAVGARTLAVGAWRAYGQSTLDDEARGEARRRERTLRWPPDLVTRWTAAVATLNAQTAEPLVREFPEQSRRWGEGYALSAWAAATSAGDRATADLMLQNARILGNALRSVSRETMLAESVAAIDRASAARDASRIQALVDGHLAYRRGRVHFGQQEYAQALREVKTARDRLEAGGSPMASLAAFFVASSMYGENDTEGALRMLLDLAAAERRTPGHRALLAQILWNTAICEGTIGRWSDSIAADDEALRIFDSLRELDYAAAIHIVLAESYAILGDVSQSQRHSIDALNDASLAGDTNRVFVALGAASSAELRRQRWQSARALAAMELNLAGHSGPPGLVAESLARLGVAEYRLGHTAAADTAIGRAHIVALRVDDEALRTKLVGEITALQAAMLRDRDPRRAIELLTESIGFHQKVRKAFALPELYLERGRCHLASKDEDGALRDFRIGIDELEAQRSTVRDVTLRAGMFDDSRTLFTETVRLLFRRREIAAAFAYAERGRARALLDQLGRSDVGGGQLIADEKMLRDELSPGTVLIEYVTLPDALIIFTARDGTMSAVEAPVGARDLDRMVNTLLHTLTTSGSRDEIGQLASDAYVQLLQPVRASIEGAKQIVIVADGSLQQLPFSLLIDPVSRKYLIERSEVIKDPSASVFLRANRLYRERATHAPRSAAIFVDPITTLSELPGAEREGRMIARLYPNRRLFAREEATGERFLDEAPRADVLHFGGHAIVNYADARRSALLLTGRALNTDDIDGCAFGRPRVVVLAACRTMVGPTATAEGATSIARSFIVGGVPSVVGTLWDIDDTAATRIAYTFHAALVRGEPPATALRSALLDAIASSDSRRDPAAWGAFELVGAAGE